jgi:ligand-binding sensor domain-containing protein
VEINHKTAAILVMGIGVIVAGAYGLGKKQGETGELAVNAVATAPVGTDASNPAAGQPAIPPADAAHANMPPTQGLEGKMAEPDDARFTHFRVGNKNVKAMFTEGKVLWVATSGGVLRYDTESDNYKLYDVTSGLLSNGIFYVGRVAGKLAAGTYGGGLSLLDERSGKWTNYNIPQGLGDAFVYDVLQTRNGDIWIATWSGVNRVRGGALDDRSKWELHTVESTKGGLPNDWVYGLAEGKNGELWLATEGGLARFVNGKWQNWNHAKGLGAPYEKVKKDIAFNNDPSKQSSHHAKQKVEMGLSNVDVAFNPNYIIALEVDNAGVVWAGTWGGGLARFDGSKWTNYTTVEGLPGNHVFMLHKDPKGRIWIGTNNGVAWQEDGRFKAMTTADGLFSNTVFSMTTGPDGSLWMGSFGGVAHIHPSK